MSETHTITIQDGKVSVKVEGVKGSSCLASTKALEALGQVETDVKTSEFHEKPVIQNINQ